MVLIPKALNSKRSSNNEELGIKSRIKFVELVVTLSNTAVAELVIGEPVS